MLLIDDNSTDSWRQAVEPYGARVRVRSGQAHRQVENYNSWLPTLRSEFSDDWVLVVDVDEYAYARRDTLAATVRTILDPGPADSALVAWKQFGSAGHRRQPKNGTVCGLTMVSPKNPKSVVYKNQKVLNPNQHPPRRI